ncbi:MarR family winged helix-turn-helix transcriptional regulator [Streptomyces uncialis]|uniref:MarR family winged helix-turn-helix transcriptional regulator n=1 Tax=Streptomyces uncialis TaxID=1048205 RepID=UPI003866FC25|nr:MarR family transcriptional regulator [Streptomyces uncialis]
MEQKALDAWTDLVLAYGRITQVMEREMNRSTGLTLSQYDVLLRLAEAPGGRMRMSDLATSVVYSTGGLTRLLARMDRAGLVERVPSPDDRRVVHAVLTERGRERLAEASRVHLAGIEHHFARHLLPAESGPVADFLHRLHEAADEDGAGREA